MSINNCVTMYGRMVNDPEIKVTEGKGEQTAMAQFRIAVKRVRKDEEGKYPTDFFMCVAWGRIAELIGNHVGKGDEVLVRGEMRNNNYTDENGEKQYRNNIVVQQVHFTWKQEKDAQNEDLEVTEGFGQYGEPMADGDTLLFDEEIPL